MIFSVEEVVAALPDFELGPEFGRGGYAVVFSARERETNRNVAVKVLVEGTDSDDVQRRFEDEAGILRRLDHPHLVRVHRFIRHGGIAAIVMEPLPDGSLRQRLRTPTRALDLATGCAVILAVAEALHHAHRAGVLHRDIKPANILFAADGTPKVSDFGIAKVIEASAAQASAVIGTPEYMAPEQLSEGRIDPRTDLYALGVVAYETLGGQRPFGDVSGNRSHLAHQHLTMRPRPLTGVPVEIADVVLRALAKDPRHRQRSLRAFAVEFAVAATSVLGPGWLAGCGVPVAISDEVVAATRPRPAPVPVPVHGPRRLGGRRLVRWPGGTRTLNTAAAGDDAEGGSDGSGGRQASPSRNSLDRLWAGLIAIVAVVSVIVLVNLVHHPDDAEPLASLPPVTTPSIAATATSAASPSTAASASPTTAASTSAAPTTRPPAPGGNGGATAPGVILNNSKCQRLAENTAKPKVEAAHFTVVRTDAYFRNGTYQEFTTVFYEDDGLKAAAENLQRLVPGIKVVRKVDPDYFIRPDDEHDDLLLVVTTEFAKDSGVPCEP